MRSAVGCLFEGYVHEWFLHDGKFPSEEIPVVDSTTTYEFHPVPAEWGIPEYFTNPQSLVTKV